MNKLNIYKRVWKVEMTRNVQQVRGRLTDDAADEGVSALLHGDEGGVFATPFAPATHRQLRLQPGVLGLQVREVLVAVLLHVYLQHNNQTESSTFCRWVLWDYNNHTRAAQLPVI